MLRRVVRPFGPSDNMSNEEALRGAYPGRLEREPASSINRVPWKYYKAVYETCTAFRLSTGVRLIHLAVLDANG